jgi:hypothetical protein
MATVENPVYRVLKNSKVSFLIFMIKRPTESFKTVKLPWVVLYWTKQRCPSLTSQKNLEEANIR